MFLTCQKLGVKFGVSKTCQELKYTSNWSQEHSLSALWDISWTSKNPKQLVKIWLTNYQIENIYIEASGISLGSMMDFFNNIKCNDARLSHLQTALAQLPDSILETPNIISSTMLQIQIRSNSTAVPKQRYIMHLRSHLHPEVGRMSLCHAHLNFKNVGQVLLQSSMSLQLPSISFWILCCFKNVLVIYGRLLEYETERSEARGRSESRESEGSEW